MGGDALVKSCRSTIYFFPAEEALYAAIDIYLVGAKWMSQWSFENDTDATQTYYHKHKTQLNITSGAEVAKSMNLGAELKTLAIDVNSWRKTFTDHETSTTSRTRSLTVNIPPKTKITFYQRQYEFKVAIYFISDSWSKEWKVGTSEDGKRLLTKECTVEIMSDDFLAKDAGLYSAAVGSMEVKTVSRVDLHRYGGVKNRDLLPERAKQALHRMNL